MGDVKLSVGLLRDCRAAWDRWEQFTRSREGVTVMFVWALAEATFWPLIPEFLLVPMAAGNRRRFYLPLAASITGTALGGTALYLFAFSARAAAVAYLARLPLIGRGSVPGVQAQFVARGAAAFWSQPLSGIPFKVWALIGGTDGVDPLRAIPIFIVARGLRMAAFATLARLLAGLFPRLLRDFSLFVLGIYLVLFFYGRRRLARG